MLWLSSYCLMPLSLRKGPMHVLAPSVSILASSACVCAPIPIIAPMISELTPRYLYRRPRCLGLRPYTFFGVPSSCLAPSVLTLLLPLLTHLVSVLAPKMAYFHVPSAWFWHSNSCFDEREREKEKGWSEWNIWKAVERLCILIIEYATMHYLCSRKGNEPYFIICNLSV